MSVIGETRKCVSIIFFGEYRNFSSRLGSFNVAYYCFCSFLMIK